MPVARLSALNVGRLAAIDGKRTDYNDALLPGFVLRVTPGGARTYAVAVWSDGAKRRLTIGRVGQMELEEARAQAREALGRVQKGRPLRAGAPKDLTVAKLVGDCIKDLQLRPSTKKEWDRYLLVEIGPSIGSRPAEQLRRSEVREWARAIKARSGWSANQAFALLRRAYSWGLAEELVETSPCERMPLPYAGSPSERVLSDVELWILQRALGRLKSSYSDVVRLLLLTGVRRSAVLGMRREELQDLDGPKARWIIPGGHEGRSKSGRGHVVPLSAPAIALLKARLEAVPGPYLFPIAGRRAGDEAAAGWSSRYRDQLKTRVARTMAAWRRLKELKPEKMRPWKIHSLRHSMATHMREDLGIASDVVSLALGHAVPGAPVTRVYDRADRLGERRAALEAWAGWLSSLGLPREPGRVIEGRF